MRPSRLFSLAIPLLGACAQSQDSDAGLAQFIVSGGVQKGPFILGSSVQVAPLDATGNPTGSTFSTITANDRGEFTVSVTSEPGVGLDLAGTGFAFDEYAGHLGGAQTTLRALLSSGDGTDQTAYVNPLTHLAYSRARKLYADGTAIDVAIAQAQTELLAALPGVVAPAGIVATELSVIGDDDDGNGYLLAVSCSAAKAAHDAAGDDGSPAGELQQLLNLMASDLEPDGTLDGTAVDRFEAAVVTLDGQKCMDHLAAHMAELGDSGAVPDVYRALDFDGDGLVDATDDDADNDGIPAADDTIVEMAATATAYAFLDNRQGDAGGQVWIRQETDITEGAIEAPWRLEVEPGTPLTGIVRIAASSDFVEMVDSEGTLIRWTPSSGELRTEAIALPTITGFGPAFTGDALWAVTEEGDVYWACDGCGPPVGKEQNLSGVAQIIGNTGPTPLLVRYVSGGVMASTYGLGSGGGMVGLEGEEVAGVAMAGLNDYVLAADGDLYRWDQRFGGEPQATPFTALSGVLELSASSMSRAYARTEAGWWRLPDSLTETAQLVPLPMGAVAVVSGDRLDGLPNQAFLTIDGRVYAVSSSDPADARWFTVPR